MEKPSILMVDDQPANLLSLEVLLEEFDARLLRAGSGEEALQVLLREPVALVLLDIQMPGMDGYEVAEFMQMAAHSKGTPIIFITAIHRDIEHVLRGYRSGAVDFLTKPIEPQVLQGKVRVFLELDRQARELEKANRELEESLFEQQRLREHNDLLLRSVGEGILSLDTGGHIIYANPVASALLDPGHPLTGTPLRSQLAAANAARMVQDMLKECRTGGQWNGTVAARRRKHSFPAELTATPRLNNEGAFTGVSLVVKDVTHWRLREQQLRDESERDPLTGLVNRRGLNRLLNDRLSRQPPEMALLYLDLDRFKPVNDRHGHSTGDTLLQTVASCMEHCTRDTDVVARVGGDEFCILLHARDPETVAITVAEKLLRELETPVNLDGHAFRLGASIGVVVPDSDDTVETLMDHADQAMYRAKAAGRSTFRIWAPQMQEREQA